MIPEMMGLDELARYLKRDPRDLQKLASRGDLPARRVNDEWRFSSAEVHGWLERGMRGLADAHLNALDPNAGTDEPLLANLLPERCVAAPLAAGTRSSVLRELVRLAEESWNVYDAPALLEAVQAREAMGTTAHPGGVAVPHPRRPVPDLLGDHVLALGVTQSGIPFGSEGGGLTDVFLLVCCRDFRTHLRVLARLARLERQPGFLDSLRAAGSPGDLVEALRSAEEQLLAAPAR